MPNGGIYSELEYLVLALIGEGLGSGYAIRKAMNRMRGSRWSSESGSVYRVLRRLQRDDLVHETKKLGARNRERTEFELTGQGRAVLGSWLALTPSEDEFGFLVDPIRTRSFFLGRLSPEARAQIVENWLAASTSFCNELSQSLQEVKFSDPIRNMAYENLLYLAEGRQAWLRKLLVVVRAENVDETASDPAPDVFAATS